MIPRSGGWYVFIQRAMGNYPGFVIGYSDWLSTCGTLAVLSLVVAEYAGVLVPQLAGREKGVALAIVLMFAALQWRGIRWGSFIQNVTSAIKTLVFVALAIAAFTLAGKAAPGEPLSPPQGLAIFGALIIALQGVLYTYDGWYGVIYFGEEVKNPKRDVLRSMIGGTLLVTAIYVVVNLAYIYVLPMSRLAGEPLAAGAVAREIFGQRGDSTVRLLAIISILSTVNAYVLTAPRILYAMSCDQLFHHRATRVNKGGTPTVTLLISTTVRGAFYSQREVQRDPGRARVLLCGELHDGLSVADHPALARTRLAATISRLGISMDDSAGAVRLSSIPDRSNYW